MERDPLFEFLSDEITDLSASCENCDYCTIWYIETGKYSYRCKKHEYEEIKYPNTACFYHKWKNLKEYKSTINSSRRMLMLL